MLDFFHKDLSQPVPVLILLTICPVQIFLLILLFLLLLFLIRLFLLPLFALILILVSLLKFPFLIFLIPISSIPAFLFLTHLCLVTLILVFLIFLVTLPPLHFPAPARLYFAFLSRKPKQLLGRYFPTSRQKDLRQTVCFYIFSRT